MTPQHLTAAAAVVTLLGTVFNSWFFWRIRAAQLESEKRVLDEVEEKYVRRENCPQDCPLPPRRAAHA